MFQEERELTGVLLSVHCGEDDSVADALLPRLALEREEWSYAQLCDRAAGRSLQ